MSEEKGTAPMEVTSTSSGSKDLENRIEDDQVHLELKHHTISEIEASGAWYDKTINIFGKNYTIPTPWFRFVCVLSLYS